MFAPSRSVLRADCAQHVCLVHPLFSLRWTRLSAAREGYDILRQRSPPWQAPDRMIAVPCFRASPFACQCCPADRAQGSSVRGSLPQGDSHEQPVNHPEALLRALGVASTLVEPRAVPTRNTTWVLPSVEPRGSTVQRTLLLQRVGSLPDQPLNPVVHQPIYCEALTNRLRRAATAEPIRSFWTGCATIAACFPHLLCRIRRHVLPAKQRIGVQHPRSASPSTRPGRSPPT